MSGALFETWVMGQILKNWWYAGQEAPLYFYRDKDGKELDGLLVRDGTLYPLEIKKTASPRRDDIRHFDTLNRMGMTVGQGSVICLCQKALPISDTVMESASQSNLIFRVHLVQLSYRELNHHIPRTDKKTKRNSKNIHVS